MSTDITGGTSVAAGTVIAGIDALNPPVPTVEIPSWVNSYSLISLGLGLSDEPYEHVQGDSVLTVHGNGVTADTAVDAIDGETGRPIIQFDGSSDYIKITHPTAFKYGDGDFMIEGWFLTRGSGSPQNVFAQRDQGGPILRIESNGKLKYFRGGGNNMQTSTLTLDVDTWYNFTMTRAAGTMTIYLNGIEYMSFPETANFSSLTEIQIGGWVNGPEWFNGALYGFHITTEVEVPEAPPVPETFGLHSGEVYYTGSHYVPVNDHTAGSDDFTFETWYKFSSTNDSWGRIVEAGEFDAPNTWRINQNNTSTELVFQIGGPSPRQEIFSGVNVVLDDWNHVAVVRSSDVITMYINGVARGTLNYTGSFDTPIKYLGVGNVSANNGGIENFFHGYLSDPQYSNYAKYTADFSPSGDPDTPFLLDGAVADGGTGTATGSISFGDWNFGNGKQDANAGTTSPTGSVVAEGLRVVAPHWSYGDWWIEPDMTGATSVRIAGNYSHGSGYGTIRVYQTNGYAHESTPSGQWTNIVYNTRGTDTFDVTIPLVSGTSRITIRGFNNEGQVTIEQVQLL